MFIINSSSFLESSKFYIYIVIPTHIYTIKQI